ncbi:MAG: hypothetical protein Q8N17_26055 [Burkholderiaceae bacterium]|nr:hypothetical protein [Burkholderiaceae bacterium]
MQYATEPGAFDSHQPRRKVTFDPSINLGHILTFVGFLATGTVAYFDLRERISNNEIRTQAVAAEVVAEKARTQQSVLEMKDDVREVRRGVNEILRNLPNKGK